MKPVGQTAPPAKAGKEVDWQTSVPVQGRLKHRVYACGFRLSRVRTRRVSVANDRDPIQAQSAEGADPEGHTPRLPWNK
jgi:hypothetical protein